MRFPLRHILLLAAACSLAAFSLQAQDTRRQESKKARLQSEIRQINERLSDTKAKSRSEMSNLTLLKKKISTRTALIAENESEIALITDSIRATSGEISTLNSQLEALTGLHARMVRTAYKNRDTRVWFMYLISSRDFQQGIRRFSYLKNISRELNSSAAKIRETRLTLEARRARLDSLNTQAKDRKKSIETEMAALGKEKAQSEEMIARLQKDKNKYTAQLQKKNREVEALNREIAAISRKAAQQAAAKNAASKGSTAAAGSAKTPGKTTAPATGKAVSTDADPALSGQFAANKGRLPWPVNGAVLESFGQHYHPVYTNVKLPYNNGVTISTKAGAPVKAVFDGEVTQIIVMPGYNQCILVQHGQYFTFYCCITGATVSRGDKVKTGQTLGSVCTIDGESRMHFELWQDRNPQNPENWLK